MFLICALSDLMESVPIASARAPMCRNRHMLQLPTRECAASRHTALLCTVLHSGAGKTYTLGNIQPQAIGMIPRCAAGACTLCVSALFDGCAQDASVRASGGTRRRSCPQQEV